MATSSSSPRDLLSQMTPPENTIVVNELPRLDLESYIQNYSGRTRFDRLLLIGNTSSALAVEALKAAVKEALSGSDVSAYAAACGSLKRVAPNETEAVLDPDWVEVTEAENTNETMRLESQLRGYRNNLIKESIRMGHEDLGNHFQKIGKLAEAAEAFSRMRPDVSTTKHIVDCGVHLALVALQRRDWYAVYNNMVKIGNIQGGDDEWPALAYGRIITGIAYMGLEQYRDAANVFLLSNPVLPHTLYNHIASPNDVAIYGGLMALATMDRTELQTKVLDDQSFRIFLEQEPHIRKAISLFVNGRYSSCLEILESYRPEYLLDIYLQPHVAKIYSKIRTKCIVQYFTPFSCVTLDSLQATFPTNQGSIEDELIKMISGGSLDARIDTKNKLLVALRPDPRLALQTTALKVARKYEQEAKDRLRRINIITAGLAVSGAKKKTSETPGGQRHDEPWLDDHHSELPTAAEA